MLTLGNKLNRLYTLYLPFMNDHCEIGVIFNKSNSFIGFNLDQKNYINSRNNEIKSFIFNDLERSAFANCFLDLRNFHSKNLDIKQQFNNILPNFRDKIHYETNETIKLNKIQTPKGPVESCLFIYVFKMIDYDNDFLFCLVERQHIDICIDKKVVRTAAIQLSTNESYEDMVSLVETSTRNIIKTESIDASFKDVFTDRTNYKSEI